MVLRKKERMVELVEGEGKAELEGKREHLKFECVRFEREESGSLKKITKSLKLFY